jgi:hypothetical protein
MANSSRTLAFRQVGIPYAKAKLKDLYERLGGGLDPEIARARRENDPRGSVCETDADSKILPC